MASYIVAKGRIITRAHQPPLMEGMTVTSDVLSQWGEDGLEANLKAGAIVATGPRDIEEQPRRSRK
jgi:hypothetical protein